METVRTPDARFAALPDFGYEPRYADVSDTEGGTLRMAWVEDGAADADPVLLLHGEPSWSFLYRRMIPPLAAAGLRVIAPDLVGFGRSDKPTRREDHSYARLVAANTGLPTGDHPMPAIWHQFRDAMQNAPTIDVARFVQSGCRRPLTDEIRRAYEAPFPDASLQAGPRAMPGLVPITPDDPASGANRAAWATLSTWDVPALIAFSDGDPITGAMAPILQNLLPGAQGRRHPVIADAGHFLQEDAGEELAAAIVDFVRATPLQ